MIDGCIAVIPARGGSKRVPRKNIRLLKGKPIIAYTIEAAVGCGLFERVIVSTDSDEIADIALTYGAEVPFRRSASLSDDFTPVSQVTLDTILRIDPHGMQYAAVCQLMANCPLRDSDDIAASYAQFIATGAYSQISVSSFGASQPWWAMSRDEKFVLKPLFEEELEKRSQDLPKLFCPTGAVWWAKTEVLRTERTFHVPGRTGFQLSWQSAIDIDTEEDWDMAEVLMVIKDNAGHGQT